jgi:hypothetical protein
LKSAYTDFTNEKIRQPPIFISGIHVQYANTAKFIGMTLDAKLRREEHMKKKVIISTSSSGNVFVAWTQF